MLRENVSLHEECHYIKAKSKRLKRATRKTRGRVDADRGLTEKDETIKAMVSAGWGRGGDGRREGSVMDLF